MKKPATVTQTLRSSPLEVVQNPNKRSQVRVVWDAEATEAGSTDLATFRTIPFLFAREVAGCHHGWYIAHVPPDSHSAGGPARSVLFFVARQSHGSRDALPNT